MNGLAECLNKPGTYQLLRHRVDGKIGKYCEDIQQYQVNILRLNLENKVKHEPPTSPFQGDSGGESLLSISRMVTLIFILQRTSDQYIRAFGQTVI